MRTEELWHYTFPGLQYCVLPGSVSGKDRKYRRVLTPFQNFLIVSQLFCSQPLIVTPLSLLNANSLFPASLLKPHPHLPRLMAGCDWNAKIFTLSDENDHDHPHLELISLGLPHFTDFLVPGWHQIFFPEPLYLFTNSIHSCLIFCFKCDCSCFVCNNLAVELVLAPCTLSH